MNKVILALITAACVSGCIKLQMPDDMVSDAIDAIKGSDDDATADSEPDAATTFTHSVVGAADAPTDGLKETCLAELETRTAEQLGMTDLTFAVISENVSVLDDKAIASCTVQIQSSVTQT